MADFGRRELSAKGTAIIFDGASDYSLGLSATFEKALAQNAGAILAKLPYTVRRPNFREAVAKAISLDPGILFTPGHDESARIISEAVRNGLKADVIPLGGDAWETAVADYAGEALEGIYFSTFWHPGAPYRRNPAFMTHFKSTYGNAQISAYAPLAYDAVWLFADAIHRSKGLDPAKIRDALAATQKFVGATGHFSFNAYGDPVDKGASIPKFTQGKWAF